MRNSWLPWVLPMGLFVAANVAEGKVSPGLYPSVYMAKIVLVTIAAIWASRSWRSSLKVDGPSMVWGLLAGVVGLGVWLAMETLPYPRLGERSAFNPFTAIAEPGMRSAFIAIRFFGLAALVPVIEEVFWRGFGLRYAVDQDRWSELPQGTMTPVTVAIVSAVFALAHPEWLAAFVYGTLMALVLRRTGKLGSCLVAHAVTNLMLGIWVVSRGAWHLW